jgi:hypothetical protein
MAKSGLPSGGADKIESARFKYEAAGLLMAVTLLTHPPRGGFEDSSFPALQREQEQMIILSAGSTCEQFFETFSRILRNT